MSESLKIQLLFCWKDTELHYQMVTAEKTQQIDSKVLADDAAVSDLVAREARQLRPENALCIADDCKNAAVDITGFTLGDRNDLSAGYFTYCGAKPCRDFILNKYAKTEKETSDKPVGKLSICGHCQQTKPVKWCTRCKKNAYCSVECQRADWRVHKLKCA